MLPAVTRAFLGVATGEMRCLHTFLNGAAVTGPNSYPDVDENVHNRVATAETHLSPKTKSKLSKADRELSFWLFVELRLMMYGIRLGKASKRQNPKRKNKYRYQGAFRDQSQQTQAVKREAKADTAHAKALALHHKTESRYLLLEAEYEKNRLDTENMEKTLESERANTRELNERTAENAKEVQKIRVTLSTEKGTLHRGFYWIDWLLVSFIYSGRGDEAYGAEESLRPTRPPLLAEVLVSCNISGTSRLLVYYHLCGPNHPTLSL
jgi:hypothetical protein